MAVHCGINTGFKHQLFKRAAKLANSLQFIMTKQSPFRQFKNTVGVSSRTFAVSFSVSFVGID